MSADEFLALGLVLIIAMIAIKSYLNSRHKGCSGCHHKCDSAFSDKK